MPFTVVTPEAVRAKVASAPPERRLRLLLAAVDGQVVGEVTAYVNDDGSTPGQGIAHPHVHPEHAGRGVGTALVEAAEAHLAAEGVTTVYTWVFGTGRGAAFAGRHGYRPGRSGHLFHRDLRAPLPPRPEQPAGVELRPFTDFAGDPRPLYEADVEASADEPSDTPVDAMSYESWLDHTWREPLLDHALTFAAVVDGLVAAFSLAETDGHERYSSGMTGTRRAFRGRGLAKLTKHESLRASQAAGYTDAYTGNDAENAPMIAVNRWLGYRPAVTTQRFLKDL
ncbi:GNAT family N-acetyltransferase [Streptomyces sp. MAR4 CNX-425]|uniref:GNAT family N-acetyltransferase n=1 Tax=Streptomyces sp. MAR4 CNX-425 TaxID=3406343 RepID=UPI003B50F8D9